jgi:transposase
VPRELGCSGVTAWRRLRDWQQAGVWEPRTPRCWSASTRPARDPSGHRPDRRQPQRCHATAAPRRRNRPGPGKIGRPRQRADELIAGRGYDHEKYRRELRSRGVRPTIARRQTEHGSGLGTRRWVVERTFAWLHFFRRLRIRWERRPELHEAFMDLGCAVICQRYLTAWSSPA